MQISATTTNCSTSVPCTVLIDRLIRSERSYTVTISTPGGRPGFSASSLALTASIVASALRPVRITMMRAGHLALAVQLGDAAAHLGPDLDARDVRQPHRRAAVAHHQRDRPEIVERPQVALHPHHVLGLGELQHRAAEVAVGGADRVGDLLQRQVVGLEPLGIDDDLVLLDHAADRRDLRNVGHRLELEAQEPVLQRAQVAPGCAGRCGRPARTRRSSRRPSHPGPATSAPRAGGAPAPGSGTRARASAPSTDRCRPRR